MDIYSFDDIDSFAEFVASVAGCSRISVAQALLGDRRPAFVVARAIEEVTGVDAHDWFLDEPTRSRATQAPPASETFLHADLAADTNLAHVA